MRLETEISGSIVRPIFTVSKNHKPPGNFPPPPKKKDKLHTSNHGESLNFKIQVIIYLQLTRVSDMRSPDCNANGA